MCLPSPTATTTGTTPPLPLPLPLLALQEHVYQPYEEVLPYETFSLRLSNAQLPQLPQLLRSVTQEEYRRLLEGVLRYRDAFVWDRDLGGRAFDYTIATLRRRYLNLKSLYF